MRFKFNEEKSSALRKNPRRGIGFEEAQEIFRLPYYLDQRLDRPEQFRAIGWVGARLYSVILEIREDKRWRILSSGKHCGKLPRKNESFMKRTGKKRPVSTESIARLADNGQDVSIYFTNKGKMMPPLDGVGIELNKNLLQELNETAKRLNVSTQNLIERFIQRGLEQHSIERKSPKVS